MTDIEKLYPLRTIWLDRLQEVCTERQLMAWVYNGSFPEPTKRIGKYKLYDVDEIVEWVTLWKRVTIGLGRGKELNEGKDDA